MPSRIRPASLWKRNPTATPRPTMIASEMTLRMRSVSDRPVRTAERAMGRLRNRSIIPLLRSSAMPMAEVIAPTRAVIRKIAGTTKSV
jgi:hypothetical protein